MKDLDLGDDLQIQAEAEEPKYPEPEKEYTGKYLPTMFELVGSDQREIQEGSFTLISFKTEAVDNFLDRVNDQGVCDSPSSKYFSIVRRAPHKGIVSFRVQVKDNAPAGSDEDLIFKLEVPSRNFNKTASVKLNIIPKKNLSGSNIQVS